MSLQDSVLYIIKSSLVTSNSSFIFFKHAVAQPVKITVSLYCLKDVLIKVVRSQIIPFWNTNNISAVIRAGSGVLQSTEPALLKLRNDVLLTADSGNCAILILLDL